MTKTKHNLLLLFLDFEYRQVCALIIEPLLFEILGHLALGNIQFLLLSQKVTLLNFSLEANYLGFLINRVRGDQIVFSMLLSISKALT